MDGFSIKYIRVVASIHFVRESLYTAVQLRKNHVVQYISRLDHCLLNPVKKILVTLIKESPYSVWIPISYCEFQTWVPEPPCFAEFAIIIAYSAE